MNMAQHRHSVYDSDLHFAINPITRGITNMSSQKTTLIQYDHNSERFTFEIPRYVDGHDMSTCNVVEVHYLNIDAVTKAQKEGVYPVADLQVSPEDENVVIGSWLISQNATQLVGSLNFLVRFVCIEGDVPGYVWNTAVYTGISVSTGIFNSTVIVEDESDILAYWMQRIEALEQGVLDNFDDGLVVKAVQEQNHMENLMFWSGTKEEYENQKANLPERVCCLITDDTSVQDLIDNMTVLMTNMNKLNNTVASVNERIDSTKGVNIGNIAGQGSPCKSPLFYDYFVAVSSDYNRVYTFNIVHIQDDFNRVGAKMKFEDGWLYLDFNCTNDIWTATMKEIDGADSVEYYTGYTIYGFKYPV